MSEVAGPGSEHHLDGNIARLLSRSYSPPAPDARFRERMLAGMFERQAEYARARTRRAYRTSTLLAAAAALLATFCLLFAFRPARESWRLMAANDTDCRLARAEHRDSWRRAEGVILLAPGDACEFARAGGARLVHPGRALECVPMDDTLIEIDERSGEPRLLAGSLAVDAPSGGPHRVRAGEVEISASAARYTINFVGGGTDPMNKKVIAGAGVATAAIITVFVYCLYDDKPVEVKTPAGTVALHDGDRAAIDTSGATQVERASEPKPAETAAGVANGATADAAKTALPTTATDPSERVIRGIVEDAAGEPLPGAAVVFRPEGEGVADAPAGASGEDGTFEAKIPRSITAGTFVATLATYAEGKLEWSTEPEAAAEPELVRIQLLHETAIAGSVREREDGSAVTSYLVVVQQYDPVTHQWFDPTIKECAPADGNYYVGGLNAGQFRVWAYREGRYRSAAQEIQLAENEFKQGVDLELAPGFALEGRVVEKQSGEPVEGAVVYSPKQHLPGTVDYLHRTEVDPRVRDAARTGADGRFKLDDLPPGKGLLVRVLHPEYRPADALVELGEGRESGPLEFELAPGTGFRGKVLDEEGNPLTGASVLAFQMNQDESLSEPLITTVDGDGNYALRNMNPGFYIILRMAEVEDQGDPNAMRMNSARLSADQDTEVDFIEAPQLATLRGRVLDEGGEPLAGVGVTASTLTTGELSFKFAVTDGEGRYEIRNLMLTEYIITLAPPEARSMAGVGSIRFERATDYERDLTYFSLKLTGSITTADGKPLEYCEAYVIRKREGKDDEWSGMVALDQQGRFAMEGYPPGEYRLYITATGYARMLSDYAELNSTAKREGKIDVVLKPGAGVSVTVLNRQKTPADGLLVQILDKRGRLYNHGLPPKTDAQGKYSYRSLDPGEYSVRVTPKKGEPVTVPFEAVVGEVREVPVQIEE